MAITGNMVKYFLLMKDKFGVDFEYTAMLGRQYLLTEKGWDGYEHFEQEDGYSENLFKKLGANEVDSFDYSDYEKATCIHDMNLPIADIYKDKYSFVFDGGTLEHIFNFPVAIKNAMEMVQKGGVFCMYTPINNNNCHGLYQFSAELLIDLLASNGFEILDATLDIRRPTEYDSVKYRISGGIYSSKLANYKSKSTMLYITAKKVSDVPVVLNLQQQVYRSVWEGKSVPWGNAEYYEFDRELRAVSNENKIYVKEKVRILLWGAGECCKKILVSIKDKSNLQIEVVALVDSNSARWGEEWCGIRISNPDIIGELNIDGIVISTSDIYWEEIEETIIYKYNYSQDKIYLLPQFEYYIGETIYSKEK